MKREQRSLAKEAKQRQRDNKSVDDIAKEMKVKNPGNRSATAIMLEKKFTLPQINCTQKDVPKILQRTLSHDSEYFTWTFGLPKIENAVKALNHEGEQKKKGKSLESKGVDELEGNDDGGLARARANTIHSIVYKVPVSEPIKRENPKSNLPPIIPSKINVTASQDVCKDTGKSVLGKLGNDTPNRIHLPKI